MPTVIDSLVMLLGLDNSGFKKGKEEAEKDQKDLRDKTNKTGRDAAKAGKEAAQFFTQLKHEAVSFFAATAGGIGLGSFIAGIVNANAKLGLFAQNMGQDVSEISAWQGAVERMGGSAEEVQATIAGMSKAVAMFQITGDTSLLPWFRKFGIQLTDSEGKMRNITDLFRDFHTALTKNSQSRAENFQAGLAAGLSPGLLNILLQSDDAFERSLKVQSDLYQVHKRDAEAALRLKQEFAGLAQSVRATLTPYITQMIEQLERFGRWVSDNKTLVTSFFVGLAAVFTGMLLPAIAAFVIAWGPVTALVLAVAAALGLLIDDWWTWLHDGKSALGPFWQYFADGWHAAIDRVRDLWQGMQTDWKGVLADMATDTILFIKDLVLHGSDTALENMMKRVRRRIARRQEEPTGGWDDDSPTAGKTGIRGLDNNNPFNLEFAHQRGARPEENPSDKRPRPFAVFESMPAGVQAFRNQLELWFSRGANTIREIVDKQLGLAPGTHTPEEMTYIKSLVGMMGRTADRALTTEDVPDLMRSMATHESGRRAGDIVAHTPTTANGQLGARASLAAAGVTASKEPRIDTNNMRVANETNIGKIEVYTQAKDARAIVRDIGGVLKNKGLVLQADSGVTP